MTIPDGAREVIRALEKTGHEAYLVGGCVRDLLLGAAETNDWDVCTDARPEEMRAAFAGRRTLDTGLRHGTLTVLMPDGGYEVTTYRIDGAYSDGRHPDSVTFTSAIEEDLSRRDFTINAMAMRPDADTVVDPFGGRADLAERRLRCVGEPARRFEEDALRILRAIRFAARLTLEIDPATHAAMLEKRALLGRISAERTMDELGKILLTDRGWDYLRTYRDILTEILPELRACIGCAQNTPWHCYDVFDHMMFSVGSAPKDLTLRMAMLLHDVGKPAAASTDENGVDHFWGHAAISAEMAERAMRRLRCPARTIRDVTELVRYHDLEIEPSERALRRLLNRFGAEQARRLLLVRRADTAAQSELAREKKLPALESAGELLERILAQRQAFSRKDLAIDGRDLLALGAAPGPELGRRLQRALDAVLDGTAENERETLLRLAMEDD